MTTKLTEAAVHIMWLLCCEILRHGGLKSCSTDGTRKIETFQFQIKIHESAELYMLLMSEN